MAPTAPLPDLPPPPVTGTIGDGRPMMIALSLTLMGGALARGHLQSPQTLAEVIGASLTLGGIAAAMALRLGFSGERAPEGMAVLKRFPALSAAPLYVRAAFVLAALGMSLQSGDGHWRLATDLFGILTAAWLASELVRCLDAAYCRALRRLGIVNRPLPALPIVLIQAVALTQAGLGIAFVITR